MLWHFYRFELRHILRDIRQLILVAVVIPMLLAPFVIRSFGQVDRQYRESRLTTYFVALEGAQAEVVRRILPDLGKFRELPMQQDSLEALRAGELDLVLTVEVPSKPLENLRQDLKPLALQSLLPGKPLVLVHFCSGHDRSLRAREVFCAGLDSHLKRLVQRRLVDLGQDPKSMFVLSREDQATSQQEQLRRLASLIPMVLVFVLFGTGSVTALDAIAGERERGSLATVLVSALSRREIAIGKWLAVVTVSLLFGILQFLGVYFGTSGLGGYGLAHLPATNWLLAASVALVLGFQVAALLLMVSVRSSSFKQAQLLYMPALLVGAALASVSWMEDLPLFSVVLLAPISGLSLALRDSLLDQPGVLSIGLAVLVGLGWTAFLLQQTGASLELDSDRPYDDNPKEQWRQQLGQDVFWYFACCAAAMVVIPGNFPALADLRGQVALNQGLMIFVALALLKAYQQPLKEGLGWRNTSWQNWSICLLAAPLLHLCANSVAIVSSWLLPVPEEMVRQMTQLLVPENTSPGELFLLIAASPALCEELAFRGCFLHAVRSPGDLQRPTLRTCLLVGLTFGAFHFSLQRLLPTAVIGVLLSFVALRTGSLWPCMLLHCCNNALALLLSSLGVEYEAMPGWTWLACWGLLLYLLRRLQR